MVGAVKALPLPPSPASITRVAEAPPPSELERSRPTTVAETATCRARFGAAGSVKVLVCVRSAGSTNVSVWIAVEHRVVVVLPDPAVTVRSTVVVRVIFGARALHSSASAETLARDSPGSSGTPGRKYTHGSEEHPSPSQSPSQHDPAPSSARQHWKPSPQH